MRTLLTLIAILMLTILKAANADDDHIVTTIKPLHSLVAGVMGETGTPILLVEGAASPHGYGLKPSQRKILDEARVLFLFDQNFETFLAKTLDSLPDTVRVTNLAQADGITLYEARAGGAWDTHNDHDGHDHGHHDHSNHASDNHDFHIWLDPQNGIALTKAIAKVLGDIYPENLSVYENNAAAQIQKIKTLDQTLFQTLTPVKGAPYIVFHDAYQYLERRYNLTAVGSITVDPEHTVSAKRLRTIRQKLVDTNAVCVFREPQFSDKVINTVIEGTNVKSATLDPLGADITPSADLYATLLGRFGESLQECLAQ